MADTTLAADTPPVAGYMNTLGEPQRRKVLSAVGKGTAAAVRGILNNDQGGPLDPPGLRMADALDEVRQSIQRNLGVKKGGSRTSN